MYSKCLMTDLFLLFHFIQFMDLRTRYTALVTLMTQYVKFASETLKRTEDEEVRDSYFLHSQLLMQHILEFWGLWLLKLTMPI